MTTCSRLLLTFALCSGAAAQNTLTVAGGGPKNLQALQTGLCTPSGVAIDNTGIVYISAGICNQIWKVDSSGQVNLFAGNGAAAMAGEGDGGQAAIASLNFTRSMVFDTAGNLYVASGNRVRKISTAGIISTFAGGGSSLGDGGPATSAQLINPSAVAIDSSNNVYIVDSRAHRVRMVTSGGLISTVAGNGTSGFSDGTATGATLSFPSGVAVDSSGNIYIADTANQRLRKVAGGIISTVAGNGTASSTGDGGPASSATLNNPRAVIVDQFNNVFIVESFAIRQILAGQPNISRLAGTGVSGFSGDGGSATAATFNTLITLAVDPNASRTLIVDQGNNRIRNLAAGTVTTFAGNGSVDYNAEGLPAINASLYYPTGIATDNAGSVYFEDNGSYSVRKVPLALGAPNSTGARYVLASGSLSTVAGSGSNGSVVDGTPSTGSLIATNTVIFDASGNLLIAEGNRVRRVSGGFYSSVANTSNTLGFSGDGGPATAAQFAGIYGLALAPNGDLYIADYGNNRVRMVSGATGVITTIAGTGATGSAGDGGLGTSATLNAPYGLVLDGAGNLFIGELGGNRIRKLVLSTNAISTYAGNGTLDFGDGGPATATGIAAPNGMVVDQSGNLFIADEGHNRVREVIASTGVISTVAGNGTANFAGDGGSPASASLIPIGITLDRYQNMYVSDYTGRIRAFSVPSCFFTFSSPTYSSGNSGGSGSIAVTSSYPNCPYTLSSNQPFVTITGGASGIGSGTITFSVAANNGSARNATVAVGGASFTVSQQASNEYNVGFFQPSGPTWVLDSNGSGGYDSGDRLFSFAGQPGAIAVVGDWNGDGRTKIGYYLNGFWALDYNGDGVFTSADKFYAFGGSDPNYVPMVGDWNGSGTTKIGYYFNGFWALDYDGDGAFTSADKFYAFGGSGASYLPVVGDWNGDHRTKVGYYLNGGWTLDYNGSGMFDAGDRFYSAFSYIAGDKPVVGDWSGSGTTKIGVYRNGFWVLDYNGNGVYENGVDKFYAFSSNSGDIPIVADWNGDGRTKVGLYNVGFWTLDYNGSGVYDSGDRFIAYYGGAGSQPIIGRW